MTPRLIRYASALLLAGLLVACGGQQTTPAAAPTAAPTTAPVAADPAAEPTAAPEALGSGTAKVVLWHHWDGAYYDTIKQILADYASQHDVTVELLYVPEVADKAQIAIPSGQGPDLIAWVDDRIGSSALNQIIEPLEEYGIDEAYLRANFAPVAADAMIYRGKVYGIPESMEPITFIYNRKLISADELPKTTDDLLAMAQTYNQPPDKYLFVYNAKADIYASAPWWHGSGVSLVQPDGTTQMSSENGVQAANLIKRFSEIMPRDLAYDEANTLFLEQKAAIIMNGPWVIADYQAKGIDFGLTPIPTISHSGQPGAPFVGVKLLMLAANAKNPQAAVDLMKYYGTPEVQAQLATVNKQVPANLQAQEQVKDDPIIAGFIAQSAAGVPLPNNEFAAAMWDPFNKTVEAIWTGAATPEQAVQDGAALYDEQVADLK